MAATNAVDIGGEVSFEQVVPDAQRAGSGLQLPGDQAQLTPSLQATAGYRGPQGRGGVRKRLTHLNCGSAPSGHQVAVSLGHLPALGREISGEPADYEHEPPQRASGVLDQTVRAGRWADRRKIGERLVQV